MEDQNIENSSSEIEKLKNELAFCEQEIKNIQKKQSKKIIVICLVALFACLSVFWLAKKNTYSGFIGQIANEMSHKKSNNPKSSDASYESVSSETVDKFKEVHKLLTEEYYKPDISEDKLLEGAISGMTDSIGDPYTVYYDKNQTKDFNEKSEGKYFGIGITIKPDESGILTVVDTFENSPAKSVGIMGGDKIIKVDGKDVTVIKDEDTVVNMIKGPENTKVKITVYRKSIDNTKDFEVTRKSIKIDNIKSEMLENGIGYIKIVMFNEGIFNDFKKALQNLKAQNAKGIVIDVRDNPGGHYGEVIDISDILLPKSLIVYTEDRNGKKKEEFSDEAYYNIPVAVLINGRSASASEILAGAIKDNKRGFLVGTKTYGKGLVQTLKYFDDGSSIKYTISRYFTPSGVCIDKIGIQPDFEVNFSDDLKDMPVSAIKRDQDVQLKEALQKLGEKIAK